MSKVKGTCKHPGCDKPQQSIGRRNGEARSVYDKDGFRLRTIREKKTYYSNYCDKHRYKYNR